MIRAAAVLVAVIGIIGAATLVAADARSRALARAGWAAIDAGRLQDAEKAFHDALAADANDPNALLGAGVAAHMLGRPPDAQKWLRRALEIRPRLDAAALILGDSLYKTGNLDAALQVYEDAVTRGSDHPQILARLERWRGEAALHRRFSSALSDHFTILFEGTPGEDASHLADRALERLEIAYARIGAALGAYPPDVITVVLYTNEQFHDVTRSPTWAAGLFDGRIRVPMRGALENPEELDRVLAHEFTHALLKSVAKRTLPKWLDEGLAVLFESGDHAWIDRQLNEANEAKDAKTMIPLARLESGFGTLPADSARLAYAESARAAALLLERASPAQIGALLADVASGVPFTEGFERRVLISFATFADDWAREIAGSR